MKKFFEYVAILVLSVAFLSACNDDEPVPGPQDIPVNYANISGTWRLAEWNGEQMDDKRYLYMVIERRPDEETGLRKIELYQNIDSSKSRHLTGTYELEEDEDLGTIIRGIYDHSSGFWNNSYIINGLTDGQMVWTVEEDASDVSVYIRCQEIPEDILNGTRAAC